MTFTATLSTDIGKVRLELGDDTGGSGILPDGSNLTDEQIQIYLDREGDVMRSVAGICEMLATRWAQVADLAVGPRRESFSQVSKGYADRAQKLRDRYGEPEGIYSVSVVRADGYSNAVPSTETDISGTEYDPTLHLYRRGYSRSSYYRD